MLEISVSNSSIKWKKIETNDSAAHGLMESSGLKCYICKALIAINLIICPVENKRSYLHLELLSATLTHSAEIYK